MNKEKLFKLIINEKVVSSITIISIAMILYMLLKKIINKRISDINNTENKNSKKQKTYLELLNRILKYIVLVVSVIFVLKVYGINVSSIVAGLGIISAIAGLALQDVLKDIIVGFNIIIDNYYSIGDAVKIDDIEGIVTDINFRVTKIKDIATGNKLVIGNRNILKALSLSEQMDIDIPLPYEENIIKIEEILNKIIEQTKENKNIKNIKYMGVNQFGDSAIFYKIRIWCKPEIKGQIKRELLRLIKLTLDENKISIPYAQLDIHQKSKN